MPILRSQRKLKSASRERDNDSEGVSSFTEEDTETESDDYLDVRISPKTPPRKRDGSQDRKTRSSERIRERRNREFKRPSRQDVFESIELVETPIKSSERPITRRSLVGNFTRETHSYNQDVLTDSDRSLDDFIVDDDEELDDEEGEDSSFKESKKGCSIRGTWSRKSSTTETKQRISKKLKSPGGSRIKQRSSSSSDEEPELPSTGKRRKRVLHVESSSSEEEDRQCTSQRSTESMKGLVPVAPLAGEGETTSKKDCDFRGTYDSDTDIEGTEPACEPGPTPPTDSKVLSGSELASKPEQPLQPGHSFDGQDHQRQSEAPLHPDLKGSASRIVEAIPGTSAEETGREWTERYVCESSKAASQTPLGDDGELDDVIILSDTDVGMVNNAPSHNRDLYDADTLSDDTIIEDTAVDVIVCASDDDDDYNDDHKHPRRRKANRSLVIDSDSSDHEPSEGHEVVTHEQSGMSSHSESDSEIHAGHVARKARVYSSDSEEDIRGQSKRVRLMKSKKEAWREQFEVFKRVRQRSATEDQGEN